MASQMICCNILDLQQRKHFWQSSNKAGILDMYLLDGKKLSIDLSSRKAKTRRRQKATDLSACSAASASYWKELSTAYWCGS